MSSPFLYYLRLFFLNRASRSPRAQTNYSLHLGEKLLVQLGTANPGKTGDEKQLWNDGLRGVLTDLRKRRIKDPSGIAAEIIKYRREFLKDDTRVVNL